MRFVVSILPISLCLLAAACSSDDDQKSPSPAPASTSSAQPDPAKGGKGSGDVGPECTKYLACCDDVAKANPQVGASCDSVRSSISSGQKNGQSTASYESACKQGTAGMQAAGYCK